MGGTRTLSRYLTSSRRKRHCESSAQTKDTQYLHIFDADCLSTHVARCVLRTDTLYKK